jgi:uncharacterized protein
MRPPVDQFVRLSVDPPIRGFLHTAASGGDTALVLTHGAGGNCNSPLLVALAESLAQSGVTVLRCNLPFRQARSFGPPRPAEAARDRQGLLNTVVEMRKAGASTILVGGQSYGGRQASMLCAEDHELADGLLLLSYPLHPPGRPNQLRTEHLATLRTRTLIVHGSKDPFASTGEIEKALQLIPAETRILHVEDAGHDLGFSAKKGKQELVPQIVAGMKWLIADSRYADS